jgi:hypothetical protein
MLVSRETLAAVDAPSGAEARNCKGARVQPGPPFLSPTSVVIVERRVRPNGHAARTAKGVAAKRLDVGCFR